MLLLRDGFVLQLDADDAKVKFDDEDMQDGLA